MKKTFISGLFILALASCCNKQAECNTSVESTENTPVVEAADTTPNIHSWILTELNGTELVSNPENPAQIQFVEEEKIVSSTVGCNTINATYTEGENGVLKFEMGLSTKMACPEDSREDEFIAAFNQVARYEVNEGVITFFNAEGNALFRGKKAE